MIHGSQANLELLALRPEIDAAYERANRTALLRHARLGESISTWRDGKVVWLSPAEVFALYNLDEFGRPKLETHNREPSPE